MGNFEDGWRNYESRREVQRKSFNGPTWLGPVPHDQGGVDTLIVHGEQGSGDTLQFCRYVPMLTQFANRVIFECQAPLANLMAALGQTIEIRSTQQSTPTPYADSDYHIPLLSLPKTFGTKLKTIPASVPYLVPDLDKVAIWQERIEQLDGPGGLRDLGQSAPKIGLVWSGNPSRQDDQMRSCPPEMLSTLLKTDGISFFNLQKEGIPKYLVPLHDFSPSLTDFSETAAAIAALDLIITVDTAVAHLAGALGKPVWVMLSYAADWRYLLKREDSPWYPTMRLFRQTEPGDWPGLIKSVTSALKKWRTQREE